MHFKFRHLKNYYSKMKVFLLIFCAFFINVNALLRASDSQIYKVGDIIKNAELYVRTENQEYTKVTSFFVTDVPLECECNI